MTQRVWKEHHDSTSVHVAAASKKGLFALSSALSEILLCGFVCFKAGCFVPHKRYCCNKPQIISRYSSSFSFALGFAECVKSYVEVMMSEIRLCQPCSIDKLQRLISLWSDHHLSPSVLQLTSRFPPSSIQRFHNSIHGINPNRPFAPVAAKQTESQEPPPPKPDLSSAAKTETAPLITRNWPSAGLVSEVYEDHRRLGVKPYTPVDYREVRNLHSDPHLFESDVDKLINDYNDGLLFSSLREESRVYGEEIVGQGELVFPEEEKHRSNKRSRSPFEARSRSRSSDYSYSSSSRSRSYSSHSSHSRSSYSSSERRRMFFLA